MKNIATRLTDLFLLFLLFENTKLPYKISTLYGSCQLQKYITEYFPIGSTGNDFDLYVPIDI